MTLPSIHVEVHSEAAAIVTLCGEHDLALGDSIAQALERASVQRHVLVDLTPCTFADSSVIRALLAAARSATRRGDTLALVIPPRAPIRRVFELLGVQRQLPVHGTLAEAIAGIEPGSRVAPRIAAPGMRLGVIAVVALDAPAAMLAPARPPART
jgi:anti-sigma B factor antagonist